MLTRHKNNRKNIFLNVKTAIEHVHLSCLCLSFASVPWLTVRSHAFHILMFRCWKPVKCVLPSTLYTIRVAFIFILYVSNPHADCVCLECVRERWRRPMMVNGDDDDDDDFVYIVLPSSSFGSKVVVVFCLYFTIAFEMGHLRPFSIITLRCFNEYWVAQCQRIHGIGPSELTRTTHITQDSRLLFSFFFFHVETHFFVCLIRLHMVHSYLAVVILRGIDV